MIKYIIILAAALFAAGCVKDKPLKSESPPVHLTASKKVYVINEGGFRSSNSSVSLYDPLSGQAVENFYMAQNNSSPGDVAQSMSFINGKFFIVVNNSGKIVVCNDQLKKTAEITGLVSPRYLLQVTNQKAYASDYKANAISVVDLNTNTKTGSIPCPGWTERMAALFNKVFVTNIRREYVYIINTLKDAVEDSVFVSLNAGNIVIDRSDKIWVVSGGDLTTAAAARLTKIDPLTNKAESVFTFKAGQSPSNLCLNKTKDTLYFLCDGVYRMPVSGVALPAESFIQKGTRNFYGLGVSPWDHALYVTDALDYSQKSNVYIYDMNGAEKKVFKAGINANGFYFE